MDDNNWRVWYRIITMLQICQRLPRKPPLLKSKMSKIQMSPMTSWTKTKNMHKPTSKSITTYVMYSAVANKRACSLTIFRKIYHPARTFLACSLNKFPPKIHPARLLETDLYTKRGCSLIVFKVFSHPARLLETARLVKF